ncbi:MAG: succinate dehydrogenase assembly factor 2 [Alphaproteobacteria bacterium]
MERENDENVAIRKRRARFRAWHRGMQEADLILGRFADASLPTMNTTDLDDFEALLEVLDQDILDWIMGRTDVPENMKTPVLSALLAFDWEGAAP